MLFLAYCSRSLIPEADVKGQLKDIVRAANAHNKTNNLTGLLVYEGAHFIQLIEGEREDLDRLMEKIHKDPRHTDISILIEEQIGKRHYPDWSMDTFYLSDPGVIDVTTLQALRDIYKGHFSMSSKKFFLFLKGMLDQIDVFKILYEPDAGKPLN